MLQFNIDGETSHLAEVVTLHGPRIATELAKALSRGKLSPLLNLWTSARFRQTMSWHCCPGLYTTAAGCIILCGICSRGDKDVCGIARRLMLIVPYAITGIPTKGRAMLGVGY